MKRFRNPNVLLRHDREVSRLSTARVVDKPQEKNVKVGDEYLHETLFDSIHSFVREEFQVTRSSRNLFSIIRPPLAEICATRNYQMPTKKADLTSVDPHFLHECLRPILIGLSLTIRTFVNVVIFDSKAYQETGGLGNNSIQIVTSKPGHEERISPFPSLKDIKSEVFVIVVKKEDGKFLLVSSHEKTWFEGRDLKGHLLSIILD